ncbi:hypothetical protein, partial [Oscillatoria salina]|uniref:hypothetical protein n=1 Tax=Oscillatoria salina TaxID=331517 RepID=UPI001CCF84FF
QQLGLKGKEQLLGDIQDGKLILQPVSEQAKIIEENGLLVVESESIDNLENIIEQLREEHLDQFLSW